MKRLAYVLMAAGVLVAVVAFNMDVTVGGSGIANINMMAQRQNLLIVGCVGFLGGVVLLMGTLRQGDSNPPSSVQQLGERQAGGGSPFAAALAFWTERDIGRKLVLVSVSLILLSFCLSWEVSSIDYATGAYALPGGTVELSQALIGVLVWTYPFLVSATRAPLNTNGLTLNGVVGGLWIGAAAYRFNSLHEYMAEHTGIQMENGIGFWLALLAIMVLSAGIFKIVKPSAPGQSMEEEASEL